MELRLFTQILEFSYLFDKYSTASGALFPRPEDLDSVEE